MDSCIIPASELDRVRALVEQEQPTPTAAWSGNTDQACPSDSVLLGAQCLARWVGDMRRCGSFAPRIDGIPTIWAFVSPILTAFGAFAAPFSPGNYSARSK
jgi:hypothetical protein